MEFLSLSLSLSLPYRYVDVTTATVIISLSLSLVLRQLHSPHVIRSTCFRLFQNEKTFPEEDRLSSCFLLRFVCRPMCPSNNASTLRLPLLCFIQVNEHCPRFLQMIELIVRQ